MAGDFQTRSFSTGLLVLLLAVYAVWGQDVPSTSSCSTIEQRTLSSSEDCLAFCGSYEPCLILDGSDYACSDGNMTSCVYANDSEDSTRSCSISCVSYSASYFKVLILYGDYQSDEEIAAREEDNSSYNMMINSMVTSMDGFSVSDDLLDSVGTLSLDPLTTVVEITGGVNNQSYVSSKVVNVTFESSFLSKNTHVVEIELSNINLKDQIAALPALLPPNANAVNLDHDLLYDFPWNLGEYLELERLSLGGNYISTLVSPDDSGGLDSLNELYLSGNNLSAIDISFPRLEHLYLSDNLFSEFPDITKLPSLIELDVKLNSITVVNASTSSDTLTTLWLTSNKLTTFEASFPNLQKLYLSDNNLTEIPSGVYSSKNLSLLSISYNPLVLNLTRSQIEFLNNIDNLDLTEDNAANSTWNCERGQVKGISVCVTGANETIVGDDDDTSDSEDDGPLIGGVVGGVIVVALFAAVVAHHKRWKRRAASSHYKPLDSPVMIDSTNSTGFSTLSLSALLSSSTELQSRQLNPDDIEDVELIHEGTLHVYWLVKYRHDIPLVSKRLRQNAQTYDHMIRFVREIRLASTLEHRGLIQLVGTVWSSDGTDTLNILATQALFEYIENGTLRDYLGNPAIPRTWHREKLEIAIDVADALVYLHSMVPPVIHGSVRSKNVLLTSEMRGKLTRMRGGKGDDPIEFGNQDDNVFAAATTVERNATVARWEPPELLASSSDAGESADVYGFGMLLLELDSHNMPFRSNLESTSNKSNEAATEFLLQKIASGELQPEFGLRCPPKIASLGLACLCRDPQYRPKSPEVAYKLREALKAM